MLDVAPLPFAGIVTERPYPPTGLSTWADVPVEVVRFVDLTLTQAHANIPALWGHTIRAHINDRYPHVVAHGGRRYLEDGHNRVVRAAMSGAGAAPMRVYRPVPETGA